MVRAPAATQPKMKFGPIHKISTSAKNHNKKKLILHYFLQQDPDILGTH
jgi:hypothetical protein